jgi:hypothetical protein
MIITTKMGRRTQSRRAGSRKRDWLVMVRLMDEVQMSDEAKSHRNPTLAWKRIGSMITPNHNTMFAMDTLPRINYPLSLMPYATKCCSKTKTFPSQPQ